MVETVFLGSPPNVCKVTKQICNKNAFQWDTYRPLVDRIPAFTAAGERVSASGPGGVHAQGGGVCLWPGWSLSLVPGGCLPLVPGCVCIPACNGADTPPPQWTDRHLWKHNLRKLRLRAVTTKPYHSQSQSCSMSQDPGPRPRFVLFAAIQLSLNVSMNIKSKLDFVSFNKNSNTKQSIIFSRCWISL